MTTQVMYIVLTVLYIINLYKAFSKILINPKSHPLRHLNPDQFHPVP